MTIGRTEEDKVQHDDEAHEYCSNEQPLVLRHPPPPLIDTYWTYRAILVPFLFPFTWLIKRLWNAPFCYRRKATACSRAPLTGHDRANGPIHFRG